MGYQIAVCDDSKRDANYVSNMVGEWARQGGILIQIEEFYSAEAFLFNYAENKNFDILLLDIEMGAMDGVSLAKRLREDNETLQIIFITGYSEYIAEGYEVAALHYLVKPVMQGKLFSVLDRAAEKLRKNERVLTFDAAGETVLVPIYQIRYADVRLNYVTIYAKESITVKMSLAELMTMLDNRFYRVGRSALVNLSHVSRVTKTEIFLQDGISIPLPRGAYEGINRAIINGG